MKLIIESSAGRIVHPLPEGETTLGRDVGCALTVADPLVSRRHLRLERTGDTVRATNLSRTNPLWLNDKSVQEAVLTAGDRLRIGGATIRLLLGQGDDAGDSGPPPLFRTGTTPIELAEVALPERPGPALDGERLALVRDVVDAIPRPGSRAAFHEKLMKAVFRTLDVERAFVALRDEEGELRPAAARSIEPTRVGEEIRVSRTVLQRSLGQAVAVSVADAGADPSLARVPSVAELGIRSVLCAPIPIRGTPAGVLYADNRRRECSFTASDLGFLELLARLTGIVLENLEYQERLEQDSLELRSALGDRMPIVAVSSPMRQLMRQVRRVAKSDASVLITGESGTGKELLARAIHAFSRRRAAPFVAFNCAAVPESLVEAELFGLARHSGIAGAPAEGRAGRFERTGGGTLLLDEVSDMSLATQARILRVLEEREVERLGATRAVPVDFRLLAATNKDVTAEVAAGRLRADLAFRLRVVELHLPPLRTRRADVLPLARHFLERVAGNGLELGSEASALLCSHDWPGNVRELRNVIERAAVMCETRTISPADLPADLRPGRALPVRRLEEVEREEIAQALAVSRGNVRSAARALGIARNTLYDRIRKYGLEHLRSRR